MINEINYDELMEKALKHVVIEALKIASEDGLPGEHHFYISFKTNHPSVRMSSDLLNQYPQDMTIVLQHQFANLMLFDDYFEVDLIPHTLENTNLSYLKTGDFANIEFDIFAKYIEKFVGNTKKTKIDENFLRENGF